MIPQEYLSKAEKRLREIATVNPSINHVYKTYLALHPSQSHSIDFENMLLDCIEVLLIENQIKKEMAELALGLSIK